MGQGQAQALAGRGSNLKGDCHPEKRAQGRFGKTFEDPGMEIRLEPSSATFSSAMFRSPKASMKELTLDQSMLLPIVLMKRDSLIALKDVILWAA